MNDVLILRGDPATSSPVPYGPSVKLASSLDVAAPGETTQFTVNGSGVKVGDLLVIGSPPAANAERMLVTSVTDTAAPRR